MAAATPEGVDLRGLRVAIVAGTLGCGGAERQIFYIARALKASGAEATVVCLTKGERWEEPIRALGVPVLSVGRGRSRASRLMGTIAAVRRWRPDVVQSMHFYTNLHAAAAGRVVRVPSIGAIRSNVHSEIAGNGRLLGWLSLKAPTGLAANSAAAAATVMRFGYRSANVQLLRNAVDCSALHTAPRGAADACHFVCVGRLVAAKRMDLLLEACALLAVAGTSFTCRIVGDGPLRPALDERVRRLGLGEAQVVLSGERHDVVEAYGAADVCILSSDHEGTPNVLLEASASGLPVVATRVGGVPDIVEDGVTGILSPPGDAKALTAAMLRMAAEPALRRAMGEAGRARMLREYDTARLPEALSRLYAAAGVCAGRNRSPEPRC